MITPVIPALINPDTMTTAPHTPASSLEYPLGCMSWYIRLLIALKRPKPILKEKRRMMK